MTRNQLSARSHRTERSPKIIVAEPIKLFPNEIEIEANVMSHKNRVLRNP